MVTVDMVTVTSLKCFLFQKRSCNHDRCRSCQNIRSGHFFRFVHPRRCNPWKAHQREAVSAPCHRGHCHPQRRNLFPDGPRWSGYGHWFRRRRNVTRSTVARTGSLPPPLIWLRTVLWFLSPFRSRRRNVSQRSSRPSFRTQTMTWLRGMLTARNMSRMDSRDEPENGEQTSVYGSEVRTGSSSYPEMRWWHRFQFWKKMWVEKNVSKYQKKNISWNKLDWEVKRTASVMGLRINMPSYTLC